MMRSLYSGVSGLKTHQTRMDVIGNNIANVNTVGFKASSVTFSELFYQTTQVASGPNAQTNTAGRNAKQVGLGTSLGSISVDVTGEGGSESTGKPFDLKIKGSAFFVVNSGGTNYFTKAGNFTTDGSGDLVTQSGAYVMGYAAESPGGALLTDQVRPLSVYSAKYKYTSPEATTAGTLTGNISRNDDSFANGGAITTTVSVFDSLGNKYDVQLKITQDDQNNYTVKAGKVLLDGKEVTGYTAELGTNNDGMPLTFFDTGADAGKIDNSTNPSTFNLTITGSPGYAAMPAAVSLDFSSLTTIAGSTSVESSMGNAAGEGAGKGVGKLSTVGIDDSGRIQASYSNGDKFFIGQIAVAYFDNPAGLEKIGDNMFAQTLNSGSFDGIGQDISANGDGITSGVLEMSNVDLSTEFTDMIVTQRGFQANSKIITTSDTMIEELLGLKR